MTVPRQCRIPRAMLAALETSRPSAAIVRWPCRSPAVYVEGTPVPLVILLHGFGSSGAEITAYSRLATQSDARGFIFAAPDGSRDIVGNQFWNATDACCDFSPTGVDDSAYLRSGHRGHPGANSRSIPGGYYFTGHSNGGFMSHRMACDHADLVAGIASLAGAVWDDLDRCTPSQPVSVLQIHGTVDDVILFDGGDLLDNSYPGAARDGRRLGGAQWLRRDRDGRPATGSGERPGPATTPR